LTKKLPITLACGDYENVRPLKEGAVEPEGLELTLLTGQNRHNLETLMGYSLEQGLIPSPLSLEELFLAAD
jgi:hypothetical protein